MSDLIAAVRLVVKLKIVVFLSHISKIMSVGADNYLFIIQSVFFNVFINLFSSVDFNYVKFGSFGECTENGNNSVCLSVNMSRVTYSAKLFNQRRDFFK